MKLPTNYREPANFDDAIHMLNVLKDEIAGISLQLNDPTRKDTMGEEYKSWRKRAETALRLHKNAVRVTDAKLKELRRKEENRRQAEKRAHLPNCARIGQALKEASMQYGLLINVYLAARNYVHTVDESESEIRLQQLIEIVKVAEEKIPEA